MERYIRQTRLPEIGEEGQHWLLASSALVVGLGGLGAPVATYLTSSGVGRIGLCDSDTVSLSNLQRQILYTEHDLDKPKTGCALARLSAMSSATKFDIIDRLTADNAADIISDYDIVIDCTDNFATRLLIDDRCHALGKPWVHGSINGFYGCVTVFNHRNRRCYGDLYPDAADLDRPGVMIATLGPVPGAIGALQAIEAIKVLTGCGEPLDGRLLMMDMLNMNIETIEF